MKKILLISRNQDTISAIRGAINPDIAEIIARDSYTPEVDCDALLFEIGRNSDWEIYIPLQEELDKPIFAICTEQQREFQIQSGWMVYSPIIKPLGSNLMEAVTRLLKLHPEPQEERDEKYFQSVKSDFLWHIIWGIVAPGQERVRDMANGIGYNTDGQLLFPIYVNVRSWHWENSYQQRAVKGEYLREKLASMLPEGSELITISPCSFFAILYSRNFPGQEAAADMCRRIHDYGESVLSCQVCCYLGQLGPLTELSQQSAKLWELDRDNVLMAPVSTLGAPGPVQISRHLLDMGRYQKLLEGEHFDQLLTEVFTSMDSAVRDSLVNRRVLEEFTQNFSQLISVTLQERGLALNQALDPRRYTNLFAEAPSSVESTLNWVYWSIGEISRFIAKQSSSDPLYHVLQYIDLHISEPLTRQELARQAHFSESHLLRLFRKHTGMSISQYITQRRINLAHMLLQTTDMSVTQVAEAVGYTSYSHFCARFKEQKGMLPGDARKQKS